MRTSIVLALMLLVFAGCRHATAPRSAPPATGASPPSPRTQAECKACNGEWGPHGLLQVASCLCRTTDAGKRCHRRADCQGMCVAGKDMDREVVEAGPPARGYFVGRCAEFQPLFGCMRVLDQAEVGPLDEPPPMLCID
jgi:hypothetical protein